MDIRKLFAKREQQAEHAERTRLDAELLEDEEPSEATEAQTTSMAQSFVADVLGICSHESLSSRQRVSLANLQWKAYKEVVSNPDACQAPALGAQRNIPHALQLVASHPFALPQHPALRDAAPMLPPLPTALNMQQRFSRLVSMQRHCIISTQLDSQGELILSATASGKMALHDFQMLRDLSGSMILDEESQYRGLDPLLLLESGRRLEQARWHPTNDNLFAAVAASDRSVHMYDAQYTQGAPYQVLSVPAAMWSGVGLTDVRLTPKGPYTAMASAQDGHIYMWDGRGGSAPRAKLGVSLGACVNSLQLSHDSNLLLAGTLAGDVVGFDLRGGTGTALSFGTQTRHPAVLEVGIRHALMQLQELRQQTSIPRSSVHFIDLDPQDNNRLAFHLATGWSGSDSLQDKSDLSISSCYDTLGVLDLMSQTVSHVHCPPPQDESLTGWSGGHQGGSVLPKQPCWTPSGTSYCHGNASGTGLSIVDFHPSLHSPCHVGDCIDGNEQPGAKGYDFDQHTSGIASAVTVPVSSAVTAVAVHQDTDEIIAGTENGALLLLSA